MGKIDIILAKALLKRSYSNDRIETVSLFAQSIYLIFASVYVCKETVEHILLSLGEGHHHHHFGDESPDHFGYVIFHFHEELF